MSKVSIRVNDRAFSIGCEPGQEAHVQQLGQAFDQKVSELAKQVGQIGDLRLFLMAALVLSDELEAIQNDAPATSRDAEETKKAATASLNDAAEQIERLVQELSNPF